MIIASDHFWPCQLRVHQRTDKETRFARGASLFTIEYSSSKTLETIMSHEYQLEYVRLRSAFCTVDFMLPYLTVWKVKLKGFLKGLNAGKVVSIDLYLNILQFFIEIWNCTYAVLDFIVYWMRIYTFNDEEKTSNSCVFSWNQNQWEKTSIKRPKLQ